MSRGNSWMRRFPLSSPGVGARRAPGVEAPEAEVQSPWEELGHAGREQKEKLRANGGPHEVSKGSTQRP